MVEDVHAKIVFRDAEGDKSKYNLSRNFPVVEKKSTGKMKFKTNSKDTKYDDLIVFHKVAPQTDGELGGNTNNDFSLSPNPSFDDATSNL